MDETGVIVRDKCRGTTSVDRISSLPSQVMDHILQCLPLNDAIRTSILSTEWRHKWAHHLLQLVFDEHFWDATLGLTSDETPDNLLKYSNIIDDILRRHDAPIHKFILHIPYWVSKDLDISRWIHFVSGKPVQEFSLICELGYDDRELPTCMFSCMGFNNLTCLNIINWVIPSLSTTFRGFPCLISLKVHMYYQTTWQPRTLEFLVSKCPLLECLDVLIIETTRLTIHAPKLQHLVVTGHIFGLCLKLEDTERIKTVSLQYLQAATWDLITRDLMIRDLMTEFFRCFALIENLGLNLFYLLNQYAKAGLPLEKPYLSSELRKLKTLVLVEVEFNRQSAISFMLSLFQMAPMLQKLEITAREFGQVPNQITVVEDCRFDHLKIAKITGGLSRYSCIGMTLQLIKMILASSSVLEVMTLGGNLISESTEKYRYAVVAV